MKNILKYKDFIGTVNYSSDDKVFFGKVEGINDLVTFEGTTVEELETAFKYMVDQHIEDCKENNLPIEKSYKGSLNIRLSPKLHKKAAYKATIEGISLNQLIKKAVEKEISNDI